MRLTIAVMVGAAALLGVAGGAAAQDEINLGDLASPLFEVGYAGLEGTEGAAPETAPLADVGRTALDLLRDYAYTFVLGLRGGGAGSDVGTPDEVGARTYEFQVDVPVGVPGRSVSAPARAVDVGTPGVGIARDTPAVVLPGLAARVPGFVVSPWVPPVGTPRLVVDVPPGNVTTPPVGAPPVDVVVPPLEAPSRDVTVEFGSAGAGFQGASGTLYLGPASVPYDVPATGVTLDDALPADAPREATLERGLVSVPGENVETPGVGVLPAQSVATPGARHEVDAVAVTDSYDAGVVGVGDTDVVVEGRTLLGPQRVAAEAPAVEVASLEAPGAFVEVNGVSVASVPVGTPGVDVVQESPVPVDDVGYFGYGRDGDSSLYPYACGPTGCVHSWQYARAWVERVDATADLAARILDGSLVVDVSQLFMTPG